MPTTRGVDPRLRVVYLVLVAVGVFLLRRWETVGALLAAQIVLWLGLSLGVRRLVRQVTKLWGFALFVLVSYALTADAPEVDRWINAYRVHWGARLHDLKRYVEAEEGGR